MSRKRKGKKIYHLVHSMRPVPSSIVNAASVTLSDFLNAIPTNLT